MRRVYVWLAVSLVCACDATAAEVKYTGAELRDPFVEKVEQRSPAMAINAAEDELRGLRVQGVLLSSNTPRAIIDGRIYKVGDQVKSGKIVAILKEGVQVAVNGKEIMIQHFKRTTTNEKPNQPQSQDAAQPQAAQMVNAQSAGEPPAHE